MPILYPPSSAAASEPNIFLATPSSPHADNDEMTSWPGSWVVWDDTAQAVMSASNTLDPWTFPTSGTYRWKQSGSFVFLQFPKDQHNVFVYKPITVAANMLVWARWVSGACTNSNSNFSNIGQASFGLFDTSGGPVAGALRPVTAGSHRLEAVNLGSNTGRKIGHILAGARQTSSITLAQGVRVPDITALMRHSATVRSFVWADSSGDVQMPVNTQETSTSLTESFVGWLITSPANGNSNPIVALDFFRRQDSATAWIV